MSTGRPIVGIYHAFLVVLAEEQPAVLRSLASSSPDRDWSTVLDRQLAIPTKAQLGRFLAAIELDNCEGQGPTELRLLDGTPVPGIAKRARNISDRLGRATNFGHSTSRFSFDVVESFLHSRGDSISATAHECLMDNWSQPPPNAAELKVWTDRTIGLLRDAADGTTRSHTGMSTTSYSGSTSGLEQDQGQPGYEELEVSCLWTFRQRTPARLLCRRTIRTDTATGVGDIPIHFTLPNQTPSDDVVHLEPLLNCTVVDLSASKMTGYYNWHLRLPPVDEQQALTFSYEIHVDSAVDDQPYLRHTVRAPGKRFQLDVQFDTAFLPTGVQSFRTADVWTTPEEVRNLYPVTLSGFGAATVQFRNYSPPQFFGLVFNW